jgi:hypothetical protein
MKSIKQLHDAAHNERQKADDLRKEAGKDHLKAHGAMADPQVSQRYANDAQKYDEKASLHDLEAAKFDAEATGLEMRVLELNREKNEILTSSQAHIDRIDSEEKRLRG